MWGIRTGMHIGSRPALLALLAVIAFTAAGCERPKPVSVIVLLDETGFADKHWRDSIEAAQVVALSLGPNDRYQVNAIDDRSGQDADVRLGPYTLPGTGIRAKQAARMLYEKTGKLERREPQARGTDIMGALREAADVFARSRATPRGCSSRDYVPVLIVFSDMRPDLRDPGKVYGQHPFRFPGNTRVRCMFVTKETPGSAGSGSIDSDKSGGAVSKPADVDRTEVVEWWTGLFRVAKVKTSPEDFRKVEESDVKSPANARALTDLIRDARR
jgi:hypothetical protein